MTEKKFTTVEQMESDTKILYERACDMCIDTWQTRAQDQKNHCKFGEDGVCCRICSMGPCRITQKHQGYMRSRRPCYSGQKLSAYRRRRRGPPIPITAERLRTFFTRPPKTAVIR
jgi:hypothetical protein